MVTATTTMTMTDQKPMVVSLTSNAPTAAEIQPKPQKAPEQSIDDQITTLNGVAMLATIFGLCVEAFGIIHPSLKYDSLASLALTRLGIEQARLLIIGSAVGVVSPPASIATKFVPTSTAAQNPDPTAAVMFDARDRRLDLQMGLMRQTFEAGLKDILDKLKMKPVGDNVQAYGLKPYKQKNPDAPIPEQTALYANRLASFREKYSLLQDLRESLVDGKKKFPRAVDATATFRHWTIADPRKFASTFVESIREDIDRMEALVGCQAYMDASMNNDISTFAYHPDPSLVLMKYDNSKLNEILTVCKEHYPDYVQTAREAIGYVERDRIALQAELGEPEDAPSSSSRSIRIARSSRSRTASPSGSRAESPSRSVRSGRRQSRIFRSRTNSPSAQSRASSRAPSVATSRASSRASSNRIPLPEESPERKTRRHSRIFSILSFGMVKRKKSKDDDSKRSRSLHGPRHSLATDNGETPRSKSMDNRRGRRFSTDTRASSVAGNENQPSPSRPYDEAQKSSSSSTYLPSIRIQFDDYSIAQNKERSARREDSPQSNTQPESSDAATAPNWPPGSPDPEDPSSSQVLITDDDQDSNDDDSEDDEDIAKGYNPARRLSMHPVRVADTGAEFRTVEYLRSEGIAVRNFA